MGLLARRRVAQESLLARLWRRLAWIWTALHSEYRREYVVNGDGTFGVTEITTERGKVVSHRRYQQKYDDIRFDNAAWRKRVVEMTRCD